MNPPKVEFSELGSSLHLSFEDQASAQKFFGETCKQVGFYLPFAQPLKQFQRLEVQFTWPEDRHFQVTAEVVQVFPQGNIFGIAFQLCDWNSTRESAWRQKLKGPRETKAEANSDRTSPAILIRNMNPNERFRLTSKASRPERQILLRDTSPQVLMGLLNHPRLDDMEVKAIATSAYTTSAILQRILENRRWMANPEIQLAVVKNPKTPPPMVLKLLPVLRTSDLKVLAKGSSARENIRRGALRIYLHRTGQKK